MKCAHVSLVIYSILFNQFRICVTAWYACIRVASVRKPRSSPPIADSESGATTFDKILFPFLDYTSQNDRHAFCSNVIVELRVRRQWLRRTKSKRSMVLYYDWFLHFNPGKNWRTRTDHIKESSPSRFSAAVASIDFDPRRSNNRRDNCQLPLRNLRSE